MKSLCCSGQDCDRIGLNLPDDAVSWTCSFHNFLGEPGIPNPSQLDRIEEKHVQLRDGVLLMIVKFRRIEEKLDKLLEESGLRERTDCQDDI